VTEAPLRPRVSLVASRVFRPAQAFVATESAGSVLLLAATAAALLWANSPWDRHYPALWARHVTIEPPWFSFELSFLEFVNSGLMAVFFYVVGLEIRREFFAGELATPRRAALPVVAALGGMVVPVLVYAGFNAGGEGAAGWGIPMATDIAFALGVLTLLGRRVPFGLKVFLLALAIVDDLGAIAVIAVFYSDKLSYSALLAGGLIVIAILAVGRVGARSPLVYAPLALLLWLALFKSGVHATVAGVVLAILTPRGQPPSIPGPTAELLSGDLTAEPRELVAPSGESSADTLERRLHPLVSFCIVPLFAFANAGVSFDSDFIRGVAASQIAAGVALGLVVGKVVGISGAAFLAVRLGLATLPDQVRWRDIVGAALLGGIGFTVSLFVSALAFSDVAFQQEAKVAVLVASASSGVAGYVWLRMANRGTP
jgi:NhaA family Na+:H+ antiporter